MASRFYLPSSGSPAITPAYSAYWNGSQQSGAADGFARMPTSTTKAGSTMTTRSEDGKASYLHTYLNDFLEKYQKESFKTEIPMLDIRHATNFTGPRRGNRRRYELPYWGRFENIWL